MRKDKSKNHIHDLLDAVYAMRDVDQVQRALISAMLAAIDEMQPGAGKAHEDRWLKRQRETLERTHHELEQLMAKAKRK